ncbi:hypothetical protein U1Q18_026720 [Sarracenia purpurea var. burkii]
MNFSKLLFEFSQRKKALKSQYLINPHLRYCTRRSELGDKLGDTRSFLRGINVNRLSESTATDYKDESGVLSMNNMLSSVSGKRGEREGNADEIERASSRGINDEEDDDTLRKKRRRQRWLLFVGGSALSLLAFIGFVCLSIYLLVEELIG